MLLESRFIPVDSIDFSNCWNFHPWELYKLSDNLVSSLSSVGILHPPILLAKNDNCFEIVSGFKRLLFASSVLKSTQVGCLVLAKNTEPVVILDIALTDQFLTRPLSLAEKARFLEISSRHLQQQEIINTFCDRLMLNRQPSTLSTILEILKQPLLLISEVHCGALQEKIILELLRLPSVNDRIAMVKLFKVLCMGDGKQKKILPLVRDSAYRKDRTIAAYLENTSIQEILQHRAMNNPQKVQHLAAFLQHQINPLFTNAETEFAQNIKEMKIPHNCTITHSPSFEQDEVTLSITFNNLSACKEWLPTLRRGLPEN